MLTENQKGDQPLERQIESLSEKMVEVRNEISKAIVGQSEVVEGVLVAPVGSPLTYIIQRGADLALSHLCL